MRRDIANGDILFDTRGDWMMRNFLRHFRALTAAAIVSLGLYSVGTERVEAGTVVTTSVGTFNLLEVGALTSPFTSVQNQIENRVPWWGSETLALEFAAAFFAAFSPVGQTIYAFAYNVTGTTTQFVAFAGARDPSVFGPPATYSDQGNILISRPDFQWMAIPEINGSVLAQMGLVLSVLWIGLIAMRRRSEGSLSGV